MIYDRNNLPDDIKNLPDADFEPLHQEDIKDEKFKTKPVGFFKDAMIRLSKNRVSMISGAIILLIVLMAIIVPNITGYSYTEQNVAQQNLPPKYPGLKSLAYSMVPACLQTAARISLTIPTDILKAALSRFLTSMTLRTLPCAT